MLRLVHDFGRNLAALADFPEDQANLLAQALSEACKNSIEHAFDEDEVPPITLIGEVTPAALTLSICDQGLPFDQSLDPAASSPGSEPTGSPRSCGHGLALIHRCADEVRWINHGPAGKELRLTKYRRGPAAWSRSRLMPPAPITNPRPGEGPGLRHPPARARKTPSGWRS